MMGPVSLTFDVIHVDTHTCSSGCRRKPRWPQGLAMACVHVGDSL